MKPMLPIDEDSLTDKELSEHEDQLRDEARQAINQDNELLEQEYDHT